jgi:predicted nucleotidyltransferase
MNASHFSSDIQDFVKFLNIHGVHYLIVGGEAVIYYGYARLTGDVDFFYEPSPENAKKLFKALDDFWEGNIPGVKSSAELQKKGIVLQFGVPPNRIDLINSIDAVSFEEAWEFRIEEEIEIQGKKYRVFYIGLVQLIKNKEAVKRYRDLEDLNYLKAAQKAKK